jgi:maleate isomerase
MLAGLPDVTAHFGRFRVTQISMDGDAQAQFTLEPMLAAAELLADAKVDVICWNGTSAGWLGFAQDDALCAAITGRTGIPACSAVLGMNAQLRRLDAKTFGLVSPYTDEIQDRIIANYATNGWECAADRRLQISENFAFATVTEAEIEQLCLEVAASRPDAILIYCTNMAGARIAAGIEQRTGIPVIDSTAAALWASLRTVEQDPSRIKGWGSLFAR